MYNLIYFTEIFAEFDGKFRDSLTISFTGIAVSWSLNEEKYGRYAAACKWYTYVYLNPEHTHI